MVRVHFGPPLPKSEEPLNGGLAQLGERLPCKQEVTGSIPVLSTKKRLTEASTKEFRELKDLGWSFIESLMKMSDSNCTLKTEH